MPKQKRERTAEEQLFVQNYQQRKAIANAFVSRLLRDEDRFNKLMAHTRPRSRPAAT